ncbi:MAG: hypothetical protein E6Q76_05760 [Rhizobium sp.]|nr:MAG: hypothetical protein E6Q76_05760 [Rhizobium sp.]
MRLSRVLVAALMLAGCSRSGAPASLRAVPPDAPGHANVVPAEPAPGSSRPGEIYSAYILAPTGDTIAFTVFEPAIVRYGQKYPLVLESHPAAGTRQKTLEPSPADADHTLLQSQKMLVDIGRLVAAGYGVISFDQRGSGESSGTVRIVDPQFEVADDLAVVDWAQARLPWLLYRTPGDPTSLMLGATGYQAAGAYQMGMYATDPLRRLKAIVPQTTWHALDYALNPNDVLKSLWAVGFVAKVNAAKALGTSGGFDPFITSTLGPAVLANVPNDADTQFFHYQSLAYFCGNAPIAMDGDVPALFKPRLNGPIDVLLMQGMRDTFVNFNNAVANYDCLAAQGGDVRLMSYQSGNNNLGVVPDEGEAYQPSGNAADDSCGGVDSITATIAFFDEHLKGIPGAAAAVPPLCLSIQKGDSITPPAVLTARSGGLTSAAFDLAATSTGLLPLTPDVIDLGVVAGGAGMVVAGIPHLVVDVAPLNPPDSGQPILEYGLGVIRAAGAPVGNGVPELVDNQVTASRGFGHFDLDLNGVAIRLVAGDRLSLLVYSNQDQFIGTSSVNVAHPYLLPVSVKGQVGLPVIHDGS